MRQFRLLRAFPGLAVDSVLTQNNPGERYTHASGLWLDASIVENDPAEAFLETPQFVPTNNVTYFYIDDSGVIRSATFGNQAVHQARLAFGNYFKTAELAQPVRNRMLLIFNNRVNHGV